VNPRNRFLPWSVLIIGIALLHASASAAATVVDLHQRLRDEFPLVGQLAGITNASANSYGKSEASRIEGFDAGRFADGFRLGKGNAFVLLRPELSPGGMRTAAAFGAEYVDAFPGVDAFRSAADRMESEVFLLKDARDAAAVSYRVASASGIAEIVRDGRGVRFVTGNGADIFLSAPVSVDSSGKISNESRWDVDKSDRGVSATLRLRISGQNLRYPIAVVYAPGERTLPSRHLRIIATATGSVSGTVTQFGGGAISGAFVYLYDSAGDFVAIATTDASGNYSIGGMATDQYRALASADAHVPQIYNGIDCPDFNCSPLDGTPIAVTDGSSTTAINFALHSNVVSVATITGTVNGPGPSPLLGVTVVLYDTAGVATASASSDGNGQYKITLDHGGTFYARTFNGLYAGLVDSLYSGINCTACDATKGTSFPASLGTTTSNINFALVNGGRIAGKLTNAFNSTPLAFEEVAIYNSAGDAVTFGTSDGSGNYISFNGLVTGNYYALASAAGFFSQLYNGTDCDGCAVTGGKPISVTLGSTTSSIDFAMHSSQAIITGKVTDAATGAPLGGVFIQFYNSTGKRVLTSISDLTNGSYIIYLPAAGRYYALTQNGLQRDYVNQLYSGIDCSGCPVTGGTPINVVFGVPFTNVNFSLDKVGGNISGVILDAATAAPAPFGFVQVFSATGILAAYGFADVTGHYTISDGLTTGDYYVVGRAPDYQPVLYANIPCDACDVTTGTAVHVDGGVTTPNINFNLTFVSPTKATPEFSNVTAPSIIVGMASTVLTGKISAGTLIPTGSVVINLDGNLQSAAIQPDGTFSATLSTGSFPVGIFPINVSFAGDANFNPASAPSTLTVAYGVSGGALNAQPVSSGDTVPFRIQIVNAQGGNLSSPTLVVTAYGVQKAGSTTWLPAPTTGNNPAQFRFQNAQGGSYMFDLKTTGLLSGNYVFGFTVAGDPTIHVVPFVIQ
jgi:hypothetical protein